MDKAVRGRLAFAAASFAVVPSAFSALMNVVQGTGLSGLVATFYFDKESGLLVRVQRYVNSPVGRVPTQLDFDDYRAVAGVKMPFKYAYSWLSGRDEFTITDVQPNVTIDPAKFGKPTPISRKKR